MDGMERKFREAVIKQMPEQISQEFRCSTTGIARNSPVPDLPPGTGMHQNSPFAEIERNRDGGQRVNEDRRF
jgi:hypothetical protein